MLLCAVAVAVSVHSALLHSRAKQASAVSRGANWQHGLAALGDSTLQRAAVEASLWNKCGTGSADMRRRTLSCRSVYRRLRTPLQNVDPVVLQKSSPPFFVETTV